MSRMIIENGRNLSLEQGHQPQFTFGLDASKASSPGIGDTYFAIDTGKFYNCTMAGFWSIVNSPTKHVYHNHSGAGDYVSGYAVTGNGTYTHNAGTHTAELSTGITLAGMSSYGINLSVDPATESFTTNILVNGIVNGTGGSAKLTYIGMLFSPSNVPGMAFKCDNAGNWTTEIYDAFNSYSTPISAIVNGDILTIVTTKNHIAFLVNGTVVSSRNAGFAGTGIYVLIVISSDDGLTVARTINVDYMGIEIMR